MNVKLIYNLINNTFKYQKVKILLQRISRMPPNVCIPRCVYIYTLKFNYENNKKKTQIKKEEKLINAFILTSYYQIYVCF